MTASTYSYKPRSYARPPTDAEWAAAQLLASIQHKPEFIHAADLIRALGPDLPLLLPASKK